MNIAVDIATRQIAWDGILLDIPAEWDMGGYKFLKHGITRIEVEDDFSVRLEVEWIRPTNRLPMKQLVARYEKASRKLTLQSDDEQAVYGLPEGWSATLHLFRDDAFVGESADGICKRMVTAFYVCPRSSIFVFVLLHVGSEDHEDPQELIARIAEGFVQQEGESRRWQLFDIGFELPRAFELESTLFDVGSKMMTFRWEQRRLLLWHFSCADRILADHPRLEEWATGYINGFSGLKGPVFEPGRDGVINWKRRKRYPIGHREELARGCTQYRVRCRHDREKNQLVVWVYQYRKGEDLAMLPEWLAS